ncbi:MAG: hypothetical protein WCJ84_00365 [Candidatus Peregrinibacteria bacterium]
MSDARIEMIERQINVLSDKFSDLQKDWNRNQINFSSFESKILSEMKNLVDTLNKRGDDHDDIVRLQEQNKAKDLELKEIKTELSIVKTITMGSSVKIATVAALVSVIMAFILKTL